MQLERSAVKILKALADDVRLRILGVLAGEPLTVSEICEVLKMRQSRVSRHLSILSRAGIVEGQRAGIHVYYSIHPRVRRSAELSALLAALGLGEGGASFPRWTGEYAQVSDSASGGRREFELPAPMIEDDRKGLADLLGNRKQNSLDHFESLGPDQDRLQQGLVDSEFYRTKILQMLPEEPGVTLDLGCGTGMLARRLAGRLARLICVDQSPNMLDRARMALGTGAGSRVEFRIGALEHLPLGNGEADTVIASMILHHIPEPGLALAEMFRVLRPGGRLILAELDRHKAEVMRTRFADFWLGFPEERLRNALGEADFEVRSVDRGRGQGDLDCLFIEAVRPMQMERSDRKRRRQKDEKNRPAVAATG